MAKVAKVSSQFWVEAELIAKKCSTLAEASRNLKFLDGPLASKAVRWGYWDGYDGRPESLDGLVPNALLNTEAAEDIAAEYKMGYNKGRDAR